MAEAGARPAGALRAGLEWLGRYYSVLLLLALWELTARSGWVNPRIFPSFATILDALWALARSGALWVHTEATLVRVLAGFGLASVIGR